MLLQSSSTSGEEDEHIYTFEVHSVLKEFFRVLNDDGFINIIDVVIFVEMIINP